MYKNQLQELAQRSCFSLPSYTCVREGPDHAPRFRAAVNFNGEVFESPTFCSTLRQAEHSAAEVALNSLSTCRGGGGRSSSYSSLAARILDETGVYKNLLQEISQRVGAPLPLYTTFRSGLGHLPVFTCRVELARLIFTGEPAKNKKQAEKNAAVAAWFSLKQLAQRAASTSNEPENNDEQEQIRIARAILNYRLREMAMANNPNATLFPKEFPMQLQPEKKPTALSQPPSQAGSKILPRIRPKSTPRPRPTSPAVLADGGKFPAARAPPSYLPVWQQYSGMPSYHGLAPPVTARTAVPVFSSPPHPPRNHHNHPTIHHAAGRGCSQQVLRMASPVRIRQAAPVFAAPPPLVLRPVHPKEQLAKQVTPPTEAKGKNSSSAVVEMPAEGNDVKPTTDKLEETECTEESAAIERLKQLEI